MPCPNDRRERSVTVGFGMTPEQKRWLDRVAEESGMSKQGFIMARLRDEAIAVVPNVRVYRALRGHMVELLRELRRIGAGGTVDERLHGEVERLARESSSTCAGRPRRPQSTPSASMSSRWLEGEPAWGRR